MSTSFVDSDGTTRFRGEIVDATPPGGAVPVEGWQTPGVGFSSRDAQPSVANDTIWYYPIRLEAPAAYDAIGMPQGASWTGGTKIRLALYAADASWQPGALVADFGEMDQVGASGKQIALAPPLVVPGGNYLLAMSHNDAGGPTVDGSIGTPPFGDSYIGANINDYPGSQLTTLSVARAYGAYPSPGVAWTTAGDSFSVGINGFFYAVYLRATP